MKEVTEEYEEIMDDIERAVARLSVDVRLTNWSEVIEHAKAIAGAADTLARWDEEVESI